MSDVSSDEASKAFQQFKAIPVEQWETASSNEISQWMAENGWDDQQVSPEKLGTGLRVLGKVAHEYDEETFVDAVTTGELPPVKLSNREMELARGGALGLIAVAVVSYAASMYATDKAYEAFTDDDPLPDV